MGCGEPIFTRASTGAEGDVHVPTRLSQRISKEKKKREKKRRRSSRRRRRKVKSFRLLLFSKSTTRTYSNNTPAQKLHCATLKQSPRRSAARLTVSKESKQELPQDERRATNIRIIRPRRVFSEKSVFWLSVSRHFISHFRLFTSQCLLDGFGLCRANSSLH